MGGLLVGVVATLAPAQQPTTGQGAVVDARASVDPVAESLPFKVPEYKPQNAVQLRRQLSTMQYRVTQQEGTEPAFKNRYWNNKREGLYRCVVCQYPLFTSATKFKSGTGWPSFYAPLDEQVVGTKRDWKMLYPRVEVHCARCEAHLGHVFNDGPAPTGKRYCMNSASLEFEATELPKSTAGAKASEGPVRVPDSR